MPHPVAFEDILDGYFPLRLSIADLLRRNDLRAAELKLSFAPIVVIDDLPPEAPVPLSIRSGRAGMIDEATLTVSLSDAGAKIGGCARWRWLDGAVVSDELDPMIRLAEPALVSVRTDSDICLGNLGTFEAILSCG